MSHVQNTPKFIKQVPWYAQNNDGKIQSTNKSATQQVTMQEWYQRGKKGFQASNYRKGACQNCGGMGHNKKDCTQRPRKIGAKFKNQKIAADDEVQNLKFNWQSKRDRWNGFQSEMYKQIIEQHEQFQQIRKKNKVNQDQQQQVKDKEFKIEQNPLEVANLPTKILKNQKFTGLGNIRNRQEKAKYLLNLDVNGPHFDPKSRAMKGQTVIQTVQELGDKVTLQAQINFTSQQQQKHHAQISSIALPTLTQKIYKNVKQKNYYSTNSNEPKHVSTKYNAETGQIAKPQFIVYEQKDDFEVSVLNSIHKDTTIKSRYQQNVFNNDHVSVWGSWYSKVLGWGYACCYGIQKNCYCLGDKGKQKALAKQLKLKAQKLRQQQKLAQIVQKQEQEQDQ